jgi:tetratricopeptide (TPR) repeat protein
VAFAATLFACLGLSAQAHADRLLDVERKLLAIEADAVQLERSLHTPKLKKSGPDLGDRRLVEAQVVYGVGNYADASIMLYDVVENYPNSRAYPEAVYLLADSLFHKGDLLSSQKYFRQIAYEFGARDPHYQESLQRLIELSLRLQDPTDVKEALLRLDKLPQASLLDSVPYVRAKYSYFNKEYDAAIKIFEAIPEESPYYFRSRYFLGMSHIAKSDMAPAAKVLHGLLKVQPRNDNDKEIGVLTHLALGRLHYERDQAEDAIDHYNQVPRQSALFDDALYEVAWVYVKNKTFDKALRALELLSLASPTSAMLPEVRILEGNLRIRKAQALNKLSEGNSAEEYARALGIFQATRGSYQKPRQALDAAMAKHSDPKAFFAQITGQSLETFDADTQLPEIAVTWVKEEPEVGRVVLVSADLALITEQLDEAQQLIERLDRAVSTASRVNIFPELADHQSKVEDLRQGVIRLREELGAEERQLIGKHATPDEQKRLATLKQTRQTFADKLGGMPNSGDSYGQRIKKARKNYEDMDKRAQEIEIIISSLEAELVAVEKFYADTKDGQKIPRDVYELQVTELRNLIGELRGELDGIRQEVGLGLDEAGIGDELASEEKQTRDSLGGAVKAEHDYMQKIAVRMGGADLKRTGQIADLMDKTASIEAVLGRAAKKIDEILDIQLAEVRSDIVEEKARIADFKKMLLQYTSENVDVGGEIVHGSFQNVSKKFYEIAVRADVGIVDVSWAHKEEAKDNNNRLSLSRGRERRILDEEYRDVTTDEPEDEGAEAPPAPAPEAPATQPTGAPPTEGGGANAAP